MRPDPSARPEAALPRSVLLALWASAVLGGRVEIEQAVATVTGADERHRLSGDDLPVSGHPDGPGLAEWLDDLTARDVAGCRAVLPVPGDPTGVPGGPTVSSAALAAGEAVVTTPRDAGPRWVLVPQIELFGSQWEPGAFVTWHSHRVGPGPVPWLDPAEAERRLQQTLLQVTAELEDLDIAALAPAQSVGLAGTRRADTGLSLLPPDLPGRAVRLIDRAVRLSSIAELAGTDDGAAITAWQGDRRRALLAELSTACRLALMAATVRRV